MIRIGIDVGGTNTDAVILAGRTVTHAIKTSTTEDVMTGVLDVLRRILGESRIDPGTIDGVMIGTTHFVNAVVQRRGLAKVGAIRIGLPAAARLPVYADWPRDLRAIVEGPSFRIGGGHEVDGNRIAPLDHRALREAAHEIRQSGVTSVGITSVFSPISAADEARAAEILREEAPDLDITLSHQLGRIGLLARENVTQLNASLVALARKTARGFRDALAASGIDAPLYITQNDGTVVRADVAAQYPVLCFASGPTNSLRGAAFLSGLQDALVVDVGGTTSDVGALKHGFPREANNVIEVGGVRTLFRMPDLHSIGLGGGTLVDPADPSRIGPRSVGHRIGSEALVFGGGTLTCTDIAVASGLIDLGERARVSHLRADFIEAALSRIAVLMADAVDRMKASPEAAPLIAVGGGAFLVPGEMPGISEIVAVPHQSVANAVGAAIARVSGEVDQVFQNLGRTEAYEEARRIAFGRAEMAGAAAASLEVIEAEDIPIAYMPGNSLRIRMKVVGELEAVREPVEA